MTIDNNNNDDRSSDYNAHNIVLECHMSTQHLREISYISFTLPMQQSNMNSSGLLSIRYSYGAARANRTIVCSYIVAA